MAEEEEIVVGPAYGPEDEALLDPLKTGFSWYIPKRDMSAKENTGGQQWTISGHDMQVLTFVVPPGETVLTEQGSMMFMHPDMTNEVELLCCSCSGECCGRILGGESCVKVLLKNESDNEGYVGLTPNFPAKIVPVKFGSNVKSGTIIAKPGAYMSHIGDVDVGYNLDCSLSTCCCAGLGACRQAITSDQGVAFLSAGGTLLKKELGPGETVTVDGGSVVAYEDSVALGITPSGRVCMCCIGGEGACNTTLSGPGKVWVQSMNFNRFRAAVTTTVIERDEGAEGESE